MCEKHISSAEYDLYLAKKLYLVICDRKLLNDPSSVQKRVSIVAVLEKKLRTEFRDTRDLRTKIEAHLKNVDFRRSPISARLKKARKNKGWSQIKLAHHLGYKNHAAISYLETGQRNPSEKVSRWVEEQGM